MFLCLLRCLGNQNLTLPSLHPESSTRVVEYEDCDNEPGWTDMDGDGCEWYELNEESGCPLFGWVYGANGQMTALEACCHCGGGGDPSNEVPAPTPTTNADNCTDEPGWVDSLGDGCSYYEAFEFPGCPLEGSFADANGLEAWDACCHCKVA